jgi:cbb3-type cytochrome oxidase subunit 3
MPKVFQRTMAISLVFLGYQFGIFRIGAKNKAKLFAVLQLKW